MYKDEKWKYGRNYYFHSYEENQLSQWYRQDKNSDSLLWIWPIVLIKCFLDQHLYATFKQIELDYGALSTLPECCKYPKRRFQKGLAYTAYRDCIPPLQVVERGRAHNHWGMGSVSANHLQGYSGTTHLAVARLEEIKLAKLEILHLIKPIQINFPQLATFIGYNSLSIKHGYHRHSSNIIS